MVTDIDDTIKITEILKGRAAVLRNTFLKAFEAVPGMRDRYAAYGDSVDFHYVSGAPWQLYRALDQFLIEESGFPEVTFHMKNVPKNMAEPETWRAWRNLIAGDYTVEHKKAEITALINACPERRFILIGDSETDPEIFAAVRDEFPDRIEETRIVTSAATRSIRSVSPPQHDGYPALSSCRGRSTSFFSSDRSKLNCGSATFPTPLPSPPVQGRFGA